MYAGRNHNLDPGCAGAVCDKGIIMGWWTNDSNVTVTLYEVNLRGNLFTVYLTLLFYNVLLTQSFI